jgi:hypothetical protein
MTAELALSEEYLVHDEPYYAPVGDEVALIEAAYRHRSRSKGC